MYSIFDVVKSILIDFVTNDLAFIVIVVIMFSVVGFSFFNKK